MARRTQSRGAKPGKKVPAWQKSRKHPQASFKKVRARGNLAEPFPQPKERDEVDGTAVPLALGYLPLRSGS